MELFPHRRFSYRYFLKQTLDGFPRAGYGLSKHSGRCKTFEKRTKARALYATREIIWYIKRS